MRRHGHLSNHVSRTRKGIFNCDTSWCTCTHASGISPAWPACFYVRNVMYVLCHFPSFSRCAKVGGPPLPPRPSRRGVVTSQGMYWSGR